MDTMLQLDGMQQLVISLKQVFITTQLGTPILTSDGTDGHLSDMKLSA